MKKLRSSNDNITTAAEVIDIMTSMQNEEQRAMARTFQEEAQALFEKHMPDNSMSYANYPVCLKNDPTKEE